MKYKNAREVLPDKLLRELQQYVDGGLLYIPQAGEKRAWGESSGARRYYTQRNAEIRAAHRAGAAIEELADRYGLSADAVRKILL